MGNYVELSISWLSQSLGKMHITIDLYKNPQIDNGIKLLSDVGDESIGLLIRNYVPESMKIDNIKTLKTDNLFKNMKLQTKNSNIFKGDETFELFVKKRR